MKFRNITREQLEQALDLTSRMHYAASGIEGGNLCWNREPESKRKWVHATIRAKHSNCVGSRRSASGVCMVAASWHAHRDFFRTLLTMVPDAVIDTGVMRYEGLEDFEAKHPATYHVNVGSQACPAAYGDLSIL